MFISRQPGKIPINGSPDQKLRIFEPFWASIFEGSVTRHLNTRSDYYITGGDSNISYSAKHHTPLIPSAASEAESKLGVNAVLLINPDPRLNF
jgi:hypothetical protein